jgi:transposase InsO family protein
MAREWAYGMSYRSHHHRNAALEHWVDHYNQRRPHSSLDGRPPISRIHTSVSTTASARAYPSAAASVPMTALPSRRIRDSR